MLRHLASVASDGEATALAGLCCGGQDAARSLLPLLSDLLNVRPPTPQPAHASPSLMRTHTPASVPAATMPRARCFRYALS